MQTEARRETMRQRRWRDFHRATERVVDRVMAKLEDNGRSTLGGTVIRQERRTEPLARVGPE